MLGNTFQSADNAALASKILQYGYRWMIEDHYGFLINIYVKLFTAALSMAGIALTEFWWKVPIALVGSLQVPIVYLFLLRLRCQQSTALTGAAILAILPIHVMQSRYPWGYEVLGVLFVTLAIWALLDFYEDPTPKTGLRASLMLGLYLISHGYIVPFGVCLFAMAILFGQGRGADKVKRIIRGLKLFFQKYVWVFPALFFPIYLSSLQYTFSKKSQLGFYFESHFPGFVENIGIFITGSIVASIVISLLNKKISSKKAWFFLLAGAAYLAPLFFGSPPHVTVERGYMLMGTYFWLILVCIVFDAFVRRKKRFVYALAVISLTATFMGTIDSVFGRDQWFDPAFVTSERGDVPPDPGSKAAGYLLRTYLPDSIRVLALNRAIEPPVLYYYFRRSDYAYYDVSNQTLCEIFQFMRDSVDVVISCKANMPVVQADSLFEQRIVLYSENRPRLWIFAKPGIRLPQLESDVKPLNRAFDREFPNRVSLRLAHYFNRIMHTTNSEKSQHESN
ncbi:glycosyltransferase family 39 protein [candidate division KSB1 bacterium]|nr:glycosyltransferase family 39 protein [candidate division KSB1 bacterium]